MAKTMSQSTGYKASSNVAKTTVKKPKKLSKTAQWWLDHPNGLDVIYIDWKAVLK